MRARLIATVAALVAAVSVTVWGVASAASGKHPGASSAPRATVTPAFSPAPPTPTSVPSPSATAAAIEAGPTAGMRRIFHQTFNAPLDPSVWGTCYPWAAGPAGCTNFSNPEYEWYLPSQVRVAGGALHLIAAQQPTQGTTKTGQPKQYACRSGMVTSYPGFRFEYGYVSMVAQIPYATGLWPGLWLAAANLKWPPEIDLLERWGPPINRAGVYFHPVNAPADITHLSPAMKASLNSGWHTLSVSWTRQEVVWYVDGIRLMTITTNVPHQLMYVIADLANFTQTGGCNGQLLIRSVDVWQHP